MIDANQLLISQNVEPVDKFRIYLCWEMVLYV